MLIHPVAYVLLDMQIFFSILLWEEITFSVLNSHLINFIFNQPLHPFFFASYFHGPPALLGLFWLSQKVGAKCLGTMYCIKVFWLSYQRQGNFSSAQGPVFNWTIHFYLLLPLWAVCL